MQGADEIALTKLDVLSGMDEIEICVAYEKDGVTTRDFPFPQDLKDYKPVYIKVKGWKQDISGARKKEDLPKEALSYIAKIEELTGANIKYVSVGPERSQYIVF